MIKFDINGAIIEFDEHMNNYNSIRKLFKINAKKHSEEFIKYCEENIYSAIELKEYAMEYGQKSIDDAVVKGVETIIKFKIKTIDIPTFKSKYCPKYMDFQRLLSNTMKNAIPAKNKKSNYLTVESLKPLIQNIARYLEKEYFNIHLAVLDALIENNIENVSIVLNEENIQIASALINNYKDGFIDELDECNVIEQIIKSNPYRMDFYKHLISEDGDFNNEIGKLVKYIGEDISDYKEELIDAHIQECLKKDNNPESIKEKISKYCKYIGVENDAIYLTRVDAMLMFANA